MRGLGECARAQMRAEVLDWHRFSNRSQIGSFIGCCPSEYSSAGSRKLGSIDRMGNKRLRCMLVEAVWRLHQWNQGWRGFQKFHHILGPWSQNRSSSKKKAIVACARLLAIDLWRIETSHRPTRCRPDPGGCEPEPSEGETQRHGTGLRPPKHTLCKRANLLSVRIPGRTCPLSVSQYRTARLIEWPVSALSLPVASTLCAPVSRMRG